MKKKTTANKQPLTLHSLLGALSFWGTATRAFLFSILAAAVFIVALTEATTTTGVDNEIMVLVYVLGSFLLLDFGFVLIARAYPIKDGLDMAALVVADGLLAMLYIVPKVVVSSQVALVTDPLVYVIFIPLVVLSLRTLLGFLFGSRRS